MTITNDDNTIDELVSVTLDEESIVTSGYNIIELKKEIENISRNKTNEIIESLNNKISRDLFLVGDIESVKILNSFKDGITAVTSKWQDDTFVVGIRFKNIDVYKYYYDIKEQTNTKTYVEKHFFYNKVYYYASTMYVKHHILYDGLNNYFSTQYNGLINSETNELLYTYVADMRRQHSDANYITKQDGKYYHTWVVDKDDLQKPIMLYYNVANPESWIIVSVCLALVVTVILSVVAIIIKLTKNKKEDID